ncbi:hypothetical protein NPIL_113781 [Nephila pilipes]|uniref:Uncharacterized protein n=1 Tax=Nephila pilipes TaxID=299642 RepID=A0A8X6PJH5_NEPPI|nr:hypothetical protein NPIL_113781 [Nephila pilipes]
MADLSDYDAFFEACNYLYPSFNEITDEDSPGLHDHGYSQWNLPQPTHQISNPVSQWRACETLQAMQKKNPSYTTVGEIQNLIKVKPQESDFETDEQFSRTYFCNFKAQMT